MLIMLTVDIKNGKCVQLVQGQPGSEMIAIENPENVAKHWEDLGAKIYILLIWTEQLMGKPASM